MRIKIISVYARPPQWCMDAYHEYTKRFSNIWPIETTNIPLRRNTQTENKLLNIQNESKAILTTLPPQAVIVALDARGQSWDNATLAKNFSSSQALLLGNKISRAA